MHLIFNNNPVCDPPSLAICFPCPIVNIIRAHLGEPAGICPECDIDGNGVITIPDARKLVKMCTCPIAK